MNEEEPTGWEDFDHFGGEEPTYRQQEHVYNIPKMVKLASGETIAGVLVNETYEYLELKWPLIVIFQQAKINGEYIPVMLLHRYALGVFNEFVTVNKHGACWWNDTDEDFDKFFYNTVKKLYSSAEEFFSEIPILNPNEDESPKEFQDDQEVENRVYRETASNKEARKSIDSLINFFTKKNSDEPKQPPLEPA